MAGMQNATVLTKFCRQLRLICYPQYLPLRKREADQKNNLKTAMKSIKKGKASVAALVDFKG
jgi:hypothetical protein